MYSTSSPPKIRLQGPLVHKDDSNDSNNDDNNDDKNDDHEFCSAEDTFLSTPDHVQERIIKNYLLKKKPRTIELRSRNGRKITYWRLITRRKFVSQQENHGDEGREDDEDSEDDEGGDDDEDSEGNKIQK